MPGDSRFLTLTWPDMELFRAFAATIDHQGCTGVYGAPRGGLPLAVLLSHWLGLPLLDRPSSSMLWVDDIVDSGQTLARSRTDFPSARFLAWVTRTRQDGLDAFLTLAGTVHAEAWVVFPWERPMDAANEQERYALSRL
jgi:hypoxanthine phosphoribosyltransferase